MDKLADCGQATNAVATERPGQRWHLLAILEPGLLLFSSSKIRIPSKLRPWRGRRVTPRCATCAVAATTAGTNWSASCT